MTRSYQDIVAADVTGDPQLDRFAAAAEAHFEAAYRLAFGLGETLAARRNELHLSQVELAARAGVPQADISRIERGKGNPTVTTLEKILDALQLQMTLQPTH